MNELLMALEALEGELREAKRMCDERDREGGEPRRAFLETIDDVIPELEELCRNRWMLELLVRLCRMRENRA